MKIIIIDDEINALSNFLIGIVDETNIDYKMFRNNPIAAIEYVRKNKVDAAFLDIIMPQINGVDLAAALIEISPQIKIIFITGYTQDEKAIKNRLKDNVLGFCYKPYKYEALHGFLKQISDQIGDGQKVFIRTFAAFDVFIEANSIKFSSAKSKELLALLVDRNGACITMGEVISFLWPNKELELAKSLYRDAVWRLRQTLNEYGLANLVTFSRAQQIINKEYAECDYWDFLEGKNMELYGDVYMPCYDWSIDTQNILDIFKFKKEY